MTSDKYKIPLVVEGNCTTSMEVWIMWENGCQHSTNCMTKTSVEIIQNDFRLVTGQLPCILFQNVYKQKIIIL